MKHSRYYYNDLPRGSRAAVICDMAHALLNAMAHMGIWPRARRRVADFGCGVRIWLEHVQKKTFINIWGRRCCNFEEFLKY